tara:strand:- start:350 stop:547 length:198 start_codon:yes stop_codon:yes gene_type:complete
MRIPFITLRCDVRTYCTEYTKTNPACGNRAIAKVSCEDRHIAILEEAGREVRRAAADIGQGPVGT